MNLEVSEAYGERNVWSTTKGQKYSHRLDVYVGLERNDGSVIYGMQCGKTLE